MGHQHTFVKCQHIPDIVDHIQQLGWVQQTDAFVFLHADGSALTDERGVPITDQSEHGVADLGVKEDLPLTISTEIAYAVREGQRYAFKCTVKGTCVGQQKHAYSVKDKGGKVHVVYKNSIDSIVPHR